MKFTDSEINYLDVGIAAQNDELKRLRAFARFAIKHGGADLAILSRAVQLGLLVPRECGLALDLVDSLRVAE